MRILLATQNKGKIKEIQAILPHIAFTIPEQSLDIPEGETSYIENALLKAKAWAKYYPDHYILSDDSGLEVVALDNAPGVISAEWAGKEAFNQDHINKLLKELTTCTDRRAKFVSYILLLSPNQNIFVSRGECHGIIAQTQSGNKGFGYDPIFIPIEYQQTLADMSSEEKNKISHRSKALLGIKDYILYLEAHNE